MAHAHDPVDDGLRALVGEIPPLFFRLRAMSLAVHRTARPWLTPALRTALLEIVATGPVAVPEMAARRTVSRQAIQPLVNELAGRGLVAVAPNPRHRRSGLVAATAKGRRTAAEIAAAERTALDDWAHAFAASDLAVAVATLRQLKDRIDEALRALGPPATDTAP